MQLEVKLTVYVPESTGDDVVFNLKYFTLNKQQNNHAKIDPFTVLD